jgi:hypothetical protein
MRAAGVDGKELAQRLLSGDLPTGFRLQDA